MLPRALMTALTVLIALAWAGNVVVGFIFPDRHDPTLNAIFAIVVGAVYALGNKKNTTVTAARKRLARVIAGEDTPEPRDPDRRDDP